MTEKAVLGLMVGVFALLVIAFFSIKFIKRYRRKGYFKRHWQDLQKYCASKETWPLAVITADKLLDEALKRKKLKGKSTGERLVSAQRIMSDNDTIWFAHNLAKKLKDEAAIRLKQSDVKKSLLGFLQALKDLGVME
ncbi:hypothetical protein A3D14_01165 [Candidatus Saccharibacteria bacterium RIFCSPHIGHO2_02_FULL_47_12]|nr:MAG: hypothetical protein A3D14_01165 [Candidatus Saccharibacteria bacterium RIFCSPHIGHO2_02_FULL_47_12]